MCAQIKGPFEVIFNCREKGPEALCSGQMPNDIGHLERYMQGLKGLRSSPKALPWSVIMLLRSIMSVIPKLKGCAAALMNQ